MGTILFEESKLKVVLIADKGWTANFPQNDFKRSSVRCTHLTAPTRTDGVVWCGTGY